ncbi:hypothetical protein BJ912DRAFT_926545 [Pholiota molesta]|nr:hypothetical protein BJ912DRAFT_926545 [Pholiota molesta]
MRSPLARITRTPRVIKGQVGNSRALTGGQRAYAVGRQRGGDAADERARDEVRETGTEGEVISWSWSSYMKNSSVRTSSAQSQIVSLAARPVSLIDGVRGVAIQCGRRVRWRISHWRLSHEASNTQHSTTQTPLRTRGVFARAEVQAIQWRLSGGVGNGERAGARHNRAAERCSRLQSEFETPIDGYRCQLVNSPILSSELHERDDDVGDSDVDDENWEGLMCSGGSGQLTKDDEPSPPERIPSATSFLCNDLARGYTWWNWPRCPASACALRMYRAD